jgi:hypothetical protein
MVTENDYNKSIVEICKSVLVELFTILGSYREDIILIGGWVPYFLFEKPKYSHVGSLDIDLALNKDIFLSEAYETIYELLTEKGYKMGSQPFIFLRTIKNIDGIPITIQVDLLTGEYGGTGKTHRTQIIQDIKVRKARGCDIAFNHFKKIEISAKMPDGANNKVIIKITDVIPFLTMKGMSIWDRYKEKDAYDIYYIISNYPKGINNLVNLFNPYKENLLVLEGLSKIRAKFKTIDSLGPVSLMNFVDTNNKIEKERIQRDAYERVNIFLDLLKIPEYQEKI